MAAPTYPIGRVTMRIRIRITPCRAIIAMALLSVVAGNQAVGQQTASADLQQAAFSRTQSTGGVQQVRFSRRPPSVGDQFQQNIGLELKMTMSMRQGNEVVGKQQTDVRSNQRRVITTTQVENGRMTAVKVHYPAATKQEFAGDPATASAGPQITQQPVHGKAYNCRRESGENGELVITDEAGNRPPTEEYALVAQQMQMVGRPNPLAEFLAGRTIAVGQKIELPNDVAGQVFNMSDRWGKVTRFTLTLQRLESSGAATFAVFDANVEATAHGATQMRLEVEGPLVVDVATCRAQKVSLSGPIGMSESRGSYSAAYQLIGTGRLQMSVASVYRDAQR
jgi:hypothetical protein